jgi:four helix bundle protein
MEEFESNKNYALKDQIFRSSLSIPSNIAEGEERETLKEKIRFYYYAKGSCGEVITQLLIAIETSNIHKKEGFRMLSEAREIAKVLATIIQNDKNKLKIKGK